MSYLLLEESVAEISLPLGRDFFRPPAKVSGREVGLVPVVEQIFAFGPDFHQVHTALTFLSSQDNATIYCNKAPSGWFQAFPGKPFKCGTCCGWEALANGNIVPSNCTVSAKPNSYKNSGSGCTADKTNCVHALTCAQNPTTGACPPASETSYQI
ncbi:hypothetical protein B0H14DRAFT_3154504 [Mycena olivaceomarginata]|nr:hypothetical protein B0H14DRAFT_3154504 [Mycena olivaceomarginata]